MGLKVLPSETNFGLARMQNVNLNDYQSAGTGTVVPSLPGTATFPGTHEPGQRANPSRRQGGGPYEIGTKYFRIFTRHLGTKTQLHIGAKVRYKRHK